MPRPKTYLPWRLSEALELIRELQPLFKELDYHILLGGGVLNKGQSEKDLDLFFVPLSGYSSSPQTVTQKLYEILGSSRLIRDVPDYEVDHMWHWQEMLIYEYLGKRIDVFVQ